MEFWWLPRSGFGVRNHKAGVIFPLLFVFEYCREKIVNGLLMIFGCVMIGMGVLILAVGNFFRSLWIAPDANTNDVSINFE